MKVLVTGAAGFLGGHVVHRLIEDGFDVTGFDQRPVVGSVRSFTGDLVDTASVNRALAGQDVVVHIGAIGDVYLAATDPGLASAVNVIGSTNIGEAARNAGTRVVYASTWEVYGQPQWEPIDEDHPCAPDHPYSITKLAGERMLLAADHLHGVPVIALRLGTAYGSGLRPNSVFRIFIDRARQGQPITIQGDGSQSRQFTHATDIARAFSLACRSELRGMVLNTVAPEAISIKQLAEAVIARYPTDLVSGPARPGDVPPAMVSSDRIRELLGWVPEVSFEAGIGELMDSLADTP
ncbi:MAG TPA: NAD-dependent epimerase/dehydratase family protein [Acidimicrobiia bacterium]|nr:NAD-dependent epimerase/dehydratase family protein [Acidimicrobiia bacterium]